MKTDHYSLFAFTRALFIRSRIFLLAVLTFWVSVVAAPAEDDWGTALSFDGTDQYVRLPTNTWFGNEFTIEAWVYTRAYGTYMRVLEFGNAQCADSVLLCQEGASGHPAFIIFYGNSSSAVVSAPQALPLNQWTHLAATFKGNTGIIYVNGYPMGTNVSMQPPNAVNRTNNYIARSNWAGDPSVNAIIDDVRIWTVARTESELAAGMSRPLSGLEANLRAYWKLDEGAGTNASDATTNGFNGVLNNGPTWVRSTILQTPAGWGMALAMDGTDDYVNVGHGSSLNVTNNVTIEAWVNPLKLNGRYAVFSTRLGGNSGAFQLEVGIANNGVNRVGVSGLNMWVAETANNAITTGQWTHVAYTRSGSGAAAHAIYLNGVKQVLISSNSYSFTANTSDKVIGYNAISSTYFPGAIEDLRVWSKPRTQAEIQADMSRPLFGIESGLVAYYRFDEGAGIRTYDATTNHNDGTLIHRPVRVPSSVAALPIIKLLGSDPMTNEVHAAFVDPGATAGGGASPYCCKWAQPGSSGQWFRDRLGKRVLQPRRPGAFLRQQHSCSCRGRKLQPRSAEKRLNPGLGI